MTWMIITHWIMQTLHTLCFVTADQHPNEPVLLCVSALGVCMSVSTSSTMQTPTADTHRKSRGISHLDRNRDASPHASVHIARAAACEQHSQLHLLKLALLQAGHIAVVVHQVLAGLGVPDVTWEGAVGRGGVGFGPAITWAHHAHSSGVRPQLCLQLTRALV